MALEELKEKIERRPKTPLLLTADETKNTISMAFPANPADLSFDRVHRDVDRIKMFSIDHGGVIDGETITFTFKIPEYISCRNYLLSFEWKDINGAVAPAGERKGDL